MGRPKKPYEYVQWTIYVPVDTATKIDLFFLDPLTGKTKHGYRTGLCNQLLREWLDKQIAGLPQSPIVRPAPSPSIEPTEE